tara:strand:- start:6809 stop:7486 length:678 start_codon:yes stop_codon:yes gene_type:complete
MNKSKFKINKFYNIIFGEKFYKKLNFNWENLPKRFELINKIITKKNYKTYLEIGCDENQNFDRINIQEKVGIDPKKGGNIRISSDSYFKTCKKKFDCIFIDGLHTYEQSKKDVYNSIGVLNENGIIFLHDCLPKSYFHQAVPRSRNTWNGDVWKVIVEFRTKENFDTFTCFIDEGVGIIRKKKNKNILKKKIKNFKKISFKEYYYNYKELMNIVSYDRVENYLNT